MSLVKLVFANQHRRLPFFKAVEILAQLKVKNEDLMNCFSYFQYLSDSRDIRLASLLGQDGVLELCACDPFVDVVEAVFALRLLQMAVGQVLVVYIPCALSYW